MKERWSLRVGHLEFNLLFAKVKLLSSERPIPQELPPAKVKEVETTVRKEVERMELGSIAPRISTATQSRKKKRTTKHRSAAAPAPTQIFRYVPV